MIKKLFVLNGIAILMVAFSHAAGIGQIALLGWFQKYLPATVTLNDQIESFWYYALLTIRQIATPAVPAFLMVSGFFIVYAIGNKAWNERWKLVFSRISTLLIPYTIWSLIVFTTDYFLLDIRYSFFEYVQTFLTSGADGEYFYVPLIIYLLLFSPVLVFIISKYPVRGLIFFGIIKLIPVLSNYVVLLKIPALEPLPTFFPYWSILHWFLYFCIGIYFAKHINQVKDIVTKYRSILLISSIILGILSVIEPEILYRATGLFVRYCTQALSTSIFSITSLLAFLAWWPDVTPLIKPLSWLGPRSFGIYLLHHRIMLFIGKAAYLFFPLLLSSQIALLFVLLVIGLGLPLLVMVGVSKSPFRKVYPYLFGSDPHTAFPYF